MTQIREKQKLSKNFNQYREVTHLHRHSTTTIQLVKWCQSWLLDFQMQKYKQLLISSDTSGLSTKVTECTSERDLVVWITTELKTV